MTSSGNSSPPYDPLKIAWQVALARRSFAADRVVATTSHILAFVIAPEVRAALVAAYPELAAALAERVDAKGLSYIEMSTIAAFLGAKLQGDETASFGPFFKAVELCLQDGTDEAIELVVVGLLEDLQNSNITKVRDLARWEPFLQPETRRAWQAVIDLWNGDRGAIARFRAT